MPDYEKNVYTPGGLGRPAGRWKRAALRRPAFGALCELYELIAPDAEKTVLGRVYVYRTRPHAAPMRVQYCTKADNYRRREVNPPTMQAGCYQVEQYAINIKIAEMRAARAAAGKTAQAKPRQQKPHQEKSRLQKYVPLLLLAALAEIMLMVIAYAIRGTD